MHVTILSISIISDPNVRKKKTAAAVAKQWVKKWNDCNFQSLCLLCEAFFLFANFFFFWKVDEIRSNQNADYWPRAAAQQIIH